MRSQGFFTDIRTLVVVGVLVLAPAAALAKPASPVQGPNITVQGSLARAVRGRSARGTVTMTIPAGYHANANPASESYLIPTSVSLTGPPGVTFGAVSYPRAISKTFGFSNGKALRVYEGRVVMSFNVNVPAYFEAAQITVTAKVKVQSCDDKTCFAPRTIETTLTAAVSK